MAKVLDSDDVSVELGSDEEVRAGIERALSHLGLTFDQLAEQAERDEFQSERARRLWFLISPAG